MLLALADGRALPASTLAQEAGVRPSTASAHLARLLDGGLVTVLPQGRHRYYRLAGPQVGHLIESMAAVAPTAPVRSMRDGTRAHALREARTCYDHVAGRLGVELFAALLQRGWVRGGDGRHRLDGGDRLSAPGHDVDYRLTDTGRDGLAGLGVELPPGSAAEAPLRYCVDWTEQRHHLSGPLGSALATRLLDAGWLRRARRGRAVHLTDAGARRLRDGLGLEWRPTPSGRARVTESRR